MPLVMITYSIEGITDEERCKIYYHYFDDVVDALFQYSSRVKWYHRQSQEIAEIRR
jgi:hypothetical protein